MDTDFNYRFNQTGLTSCVILMFHLCRQTSSMSTDAVHQFGERTGGVPAAPLLMQLRQRREEVLEGAHTPRPRPGAGAVLAGPGATGRGGGVGRWPLARRAGPGVAVPQKPVSLLRDI